jgi:hypothetical protein
MGCGGSTYQKSYHRDTDLRPTRPRSRRRIGSDQNDQIDTVVVENDQIDTVVIENAIDPIQNDDTENNNAVETDSCSIRRDSGEWNLCNDSVASIEDWNWDTVRGSSEIRGSNSIRRRRVTIHDSDDGISRYSNTTMGLTWPQSQACHKLKSIILDLERRSVKINKDQEEVLVRHLDRIGKLRRKKDAHRDRIWVSYSEQRSPRSVIRLRLNNKSIKRRKALERFAQRVQDADNSRYRINDRLRLCSERSHSSLAQLRESEELDDKNDKNVMSGRPMYQSIHHD